MAVETDDGVKIGAWLAAEADGGVEVGIRIWDWYIGW